jgi:hypothetical protein
MVIVRDERRMDADITDAVLLNGSPPTTDMVR